MSTDHSNIFVTIVEEVQEVPEPKTPEPIAPPSTPEPWVQQGTQPSLETAWAQYVASRGFSRDSR